MSLIRRSALPAAGESDHVHARSIREAECQLDGRTKKAGTQMPLNYIG